MYQTGLFNLFLNKRSNNTFFVDSFTEMYVDWKDTNIDEWTAPNVVARGQTSALHTVEDTIPGIKGDHGQHEITAGFRHHSNLL